ncbi:MAG: lipoprotein [Gammaproteobacteria bacterium]
MEISSLQIGIKVIGKTVFLGLVCLYTLSACGKKGPLYIPVNVEPELVATDTAEKNKSKKSDNQAVTTPEIGDLDKSTDKSSE